jgi:hypothetical protein
MPVSPAPRHRFHFSGRFLIPFLIVAVTFVGPTAGAAATQPTTQAVWQTVAGGQLMLRPFPHAPYPHASREDGWKGRSVNYPLDPHYIDATVGIFIPPGYVPGETVDFIVHFHGHNNHVSNVIPHYRLAEQLAAAKLNAILIVPQGPKDVPDSGGGKLELDAGAFAQLVEEVTAFLVAEGKIRTTKIGRIVITSHSGGYKVTAAVLDHGGLADHVTDVLLLDSSYGSLERFASWAAASPKHRLVSLYTDHLAAANKELMGLLTAAKTPYVAVDEATATDAELARRGTTFMATKVAHDQVPIEYFGRLIRTSELGH